MKDVLEDVDAWTARGDAVALATVISVKRSAPRPPGSKMAINEHGEISGAVSGGCVEGAVVEVAEQVLQRRRRRGCCTSASPTRRRGTSGCRAAARSTSRWSATSRERAGRVRRARPRAAGAARWSPCSTGRPRAPSCWSPPTARAGLARRPGARRRGGAHAEELMWAERAERRDGDAVRRRHLPAAAADRASARSTSRPRCAGWRAATGWRPFVVDPRARFAQPARFPDAEEVVAAWPEEAFAGSAASTARPRSPCSPTTRSSTTRRWSLALRSDAGYIGAMGSRRAQASRRERLLGQGHRGGRAGADRRADRARPRRADRGGDRAVDHGRDRGDAARAQRRPARARAAAASTRSAC